MKPRNEKEKLLQKYIDECRFSAPTLAQLHKMLEICKLRNHTFTDFRISQTINGHRYEKLYEIEQCARNNRGEYLFAIVLASVADTESKALASRGFRSFCYNNQSYCHYAPLTIKKENPSIRWDYENATEIGNCHAKAEHAYNIAITDVFDAQSTFYVFVGNIYETYQKLGYGGILNYLSVNHKLLPSYMMRPIKVMMHHKYQPTSMSKWIRAMQIKHQLHRDICNKEGVCIDDLDTAYNHLVDKYDDLLLARKRKAEIARVIKEVEQQKQIGRDPNKDYIKRVKKYLGIVIASRCCTITPLQSVNEFYEEAQDMHHCVYAMQYYKKKDTLILSVKDKGGNRIATVEYDYMSNEIRQCRGKYNSVPPMYDEIIKIIKRNKHVFVDARNGKRRKSA